MYLHVRYMCVIVLCLCRYDKHREEILRGGTCTCKYIYTCIADCRVFLSPLPQLGLILRMTVSISCPFSPPRASPGMEMTPGYVVVPVV